MFSDNVEFLHKYLTQPTVTKGDRIIHALNFLLCAVKYAPTTIHYEQRTAISKLRDLFNNWIPKASMKPPTPSPSPPTIKYPAPPSPVAKRVEPTISIRDGTRRRSINISPTPDALQYFCLGPVQKSKCLQGWPRHIQGWCQLKS